MHKIGIESVILNWLIRVLVNRYEKLLDYTVHVTTCNLVQNENPVVTRLYKRIYLNLRANPANFELQGDRRE